MFTYFIKMKKNEWKVKAMLYGTIAQIMDNQDEIKDMLDLVKRLYEELKDVPTEDLQKEFVSKLANTVLGIIVTTQHTTNNILNICLIFFIN